jgi:hypothetical protein
VETIHIVSTEHAGFPETQEEKHAALESVPTVPLPKHIGIDTSETHILPYFTSSKTQSTAPITTFFDKKLGVPKPKKEEETGHFDICDDDHYAERFAVCHDDHDAEHFAVRHDEHDGYFAMCDDEPNARHFAVCDAELDAERITIPKTQDELFDRLPIVFSLHGTNGNEHQDIEKLPVQICTELQKRFKAFHNAKKYKREALLTLLRGPERYIVRPYCVTDQVLRGLAVKRKGKAIPSQNFFLGGELGHSADDKCIKESIPCTHIVEYNGDFALCFVPLPNKRRGGMSWDDLGFWVLDACSAKRANLCSVFG